VVVKAFVLGVAEWLEIVGSGFPDFKKQSIKRKSIE
jgi:hypothetical protein